jgi:hypothetical protein
MFKLIDELKPHGKMGIIMVVTFRIRSTSVKYGLFNMELEELMRPKKGIIMAILSLSAISILHSGYTDRPFSLAFVVSCSSN